MVINALKPTSKGLLGLVTIPLSFIYGLAVRFRLFLFSIGFPKPRKIEGVRVVSIGNLTVGGTGKTPVTIMIAKMLGDRTAVVSRGYGRKSREPVQFVSNGEKILEKFPQAADEPLVCAMALKTVPMICAPKRVDGIKAAVNLFGARTVILDDAFSHLSAHRDFDVLLVDATDPFGGGWMLPAGTLREPASSLKRADAVIITRADMADDLDSLRKRIRELAGKEIRIFTCDVAPASLTGPDGELPHAKLAGAEVRLLSGLGSPNQFEETVKKLGATVNGHFVFPDHHPFTEDELKAAVESLENSELLLTTAKDIVRMPVSYRRFFHVLNVEAKVREADFPSFIAK